MTHSCIRITRATRPLWVALAAATLGSGVALAQPFASGLSYERSGNANSAWNATGQPQDTAGAIPWGPLSTPLPGAGTATPPSPHWGTAQPSGPSPMWATLSDNGSSWGGHVERFSGADSAPVTWVAPPPGPYPTSPNELSEGRATMPTFEPRGAQPYGPSSGYPYASPQVPMAPAYGPPPRGPYPPIPEMGPYGPGPVTPPPGYGPPPSYGPPPEPMPAPAYGPPLRGPYPPVPEMEPYGRMPYYPPESAYSIRPYAIGPMWPDSAYGPPPIWRDPGWRPQ